MAVTRKEVAQLAGVSVATVSYVLNQTKNVTPAVRERVLNAVKELHYRPNLLAKSLATKETRHVAMLIDNIQNSHYATLLGGVQHVAEREGYIVSVLSANYSSKESMLELISRGVDGVILTFGFYSLHDFASDLHLPAVYADDHIRLDYRGAIFDIITCLKSLGHRRIAFLGGLPQLSDSVRYHLFLEALQNCGLPACTELHFQGEGYTDENAGYESADRLLRCGQPFSAVFVLNDLMAIGAMQRFREAGLRIPEDISVVGCDDIKSAAYTAPALSTIQCHTFSFGETLMQQLLSLLHPEVYPPIEEKIIQAEFVRRESVGPAPSTCKQEDHP